MNGPQSGPEGQSPSKQWAKTSQASRFVLFPSLGGNRAESGQEASSGPPKGARSADKSSHQSSKTPRSTDKLPKIPFFICGLRLCRACHARRAEVYQPPARALYRARIYEVRAGGAPSQMRKGRSITDWCCQPDTTLLLI